MRSASAAATVRGVSRQAAASWNSVLNSINCVPVRA